MSDEVKEYQYAGFWLRFVAVFIDALLISVVTLPLLLMIYGMSYFETSSESFAGLWDALLQSVLPIALTIFFWQKYRATPGKLALKLEVIDEKTGGTMSFWQSVGRYFCYVLSGLILMLGFIWAAFDKKKRALHDIICGTVVVRRGS
jgi:uncharacterized RDD family membrane protein YckC